MILILYIVLVLYSLIYSGILAFLITQIKCISGHCFQALKGHRLPQSWMWNSKYKFSALFSPWTTLGDWIPLSSRDLWMCHIQVYKEQWITLNIELFDKLNNSELFDKLNNSDLGVTLLLLTKLFNLLNNSDLKASSDWADLTCSGKLFHGLATATGKKTHHLTNRCANSPQFPRWCVNTQR